MTGWSLMSIRDDELQLKVCMQFCRVVCFFVIFVLTSLLMGVSKTP